MNAWTIPAAVGAAALLGLAACGAPSGTSSTAGPETSAQVMTDATESEATGIGAPGVIANCKRADSEPKTITVTCGDAGFMLQDLEWARWDANGAEGTGTASVNNCEPSCADGTFGDYKADVTLSKFEDCKEQPIFTEVTIHFVDESPEGFDDPYVSKLPCGPSS